MADEQWLDAMWPFVRERLPAPSARVVELGCGHCRDLEPVDALVASASLHHVADLELVLDRIHALLKPAGTVAIVEWAHERFDEPTARWCFDRLAAGEQEHSWLREHRDRWRESGQTWAAYLQAWIGEERLHPGEAIMRGPQSRFHVQEASDGPYFFADLDGVTEADGQRAIDSGLILANRLTFVGQK